MCKADVSTLNTIPEDVEVSPSSEEKPENDTGKRLHLRVWMNMADVDPVRSPDVTMDSASTRTTRIIKNLRRRMSALFEFPDPPETSMSEHMSLCSSYRDENKIA